MAAFFYVTTSVMALALLLTP